MRVSETMICIQWDKLNNDQDQLWTRHSRIKTTEYRKQLCLKMTHWIEFSEICLNTLEIQTRDEFFRDQIIQLFQWMKFDNSQYKLIISLPKTWSVRFFARVFTLSSYIICSGFIAIIAAAYKSNEQVIFEMNSFFGLFLKNHCIT